MIGKFPLSGYLPGLDEVPVREMLLLVVGVRGAGPVHQVEVDIAGVEGLQRRVDSFGDDVVPGVVELGGDPDFLTGDTRVFNSLSDLCFIAVCEGTAGLIIRPVSEQAAREVQQKATLRIDMAVSLQQRMLNGLADLVGLRLPCSQADSWNLGSGVEGECFPVD